MRSQVFQRIRILGILSSSLLLLLLATTILLLWHPGRALGQAQRDLDASQEELAVVARGLAEQSPPDISALKQDTLFVLSRLGEHLESIAAGTDADITPALEATHQLQALVHSLSAADIPPAGTTVRVVDEINSLLAVLDAVELDVSRLYRQAGRQARTQILAYAMVGFGSALLVVAGTLLYAIPRHVVRPLLGRLEEQARNITAFRERETLLSAITDNTPALICQVTADGTVLYGNPAFSEFIAAAGGVPQKRLGTLFGCPHASENKLGCGHGGACGRCELRGAIAECLATNLPVTNFEYWRKLTRGGRSEKVTLLGSAAPVEFGGVKSVLLCLQDMTERKKLEAELEAREARFRSYLQHAPLSVLIADKTGRYVDANETAARDLGFNREELLARTMCDLSHPESAVQARIHCDRLRSEAHVASEIAFRRGDGADLEMEVHSARMDDGFTLNFHVNLQDRRRAQETLFRQAKLDNIIAEISKSMVARNYDHGIPELIITRAMEITESSDGWIVSGESPESGLEVFRPGAAPAKLSIAEDEGGNSHASQARARAIWKSFGKRMSPVVSNSGAFEGPPAPTCSNMMVVPIIHEDHWLGHFVLAGGRRCYTDDDLSGVSRIAEMFRLYRHGREIREQLDSSREQFLHAQKLEALGRLAGGVAHDFNNILGVIIGYSDYILMKDKAAQPYREHLGHVRKAALRGAELTRQLLAFARKQSVQPQTLNLNESVGAMVKLLERLAGENVQLRWHPAAEPVCVSMDPSQLDQLLANLVVNARDAITGQGTISIAVQSVEVSPQADSDPPGSGSYAVLRISDDGCGMGQETLSRMFEPFFTTKPDGVGTGLGLATVYGIVHQNGGFIEPVSRVGEGTTFNIYLPEYQGGPRVGTSKMLRGFKPSRGTETVLLVDDQLDFRDACARILEMLGYKVITAESGPEAIGVMEQCGGEIDILVTDVVMPGINGYELWQHLRGARQNLKCLFMSGYTADILSEDRLLGEGVHLIAKPFSTHSLGTKLREVIDN